MRQPRKRRWLPPAALPTGSPFPCRWNHSGVRGDHGASRILAAPSGGTIMGGPTGGRAGASHRGRLSSRHATARERSRSPSALEPHRSGARLNACAPAPPRRVTTQCLSPQPPPRSRARSPMRSAMSTLRDGRPPDLPPHPLATDSGGPRRAGRCGDAGVMAHRRGDRPLAPTGPIRPTAG